MERALQRKAREVAAAIGAVDITFTADVRRPNERVRDKASPLPQGKHVVAVGAGKCRVGKSTVVVNLAVGLARHGAKTGLLDGDIHRYSIATTPSAVPTHREQPAAPARVDVIHLRPARSRR